MEDIKQLRIEKVEVAGTGTNQSGPWTRYKIKTDDGWYSAFNLSLVPGETGTFNVKIESGTKIDPKTNQPYLNKTIIGYTGSIDTIPAKPFRSSAAAQPASQPSTNLSDIQRLESNQREMAIMLDGVFTRLKRLEGKVFAGDLDHEPDQDISY